MRRVLLSVLVVTLWAQAAENTVYLAPRSFPELPANLVQALEQRGCTIPQATFGSGRNNVIQGEFAKPGQTDWAVLCSVEGVSSILVFWNASGRDPAVIADEPDEYRLGRDAAGTVHYNRMISPVGKDYIDQHHALYGGPAPPPGDHQGINDAFVEKASVVHFYAQGTWHRLTGAD